ncbi:hypothetical protein [Aurantimonas coralicida]|uniref:hypothetical protein n=1 Tax=Aurantimonas coralicida TaxID=182270 RepID=UPI001E5ECC81|nr:hypothetical protein [Aurantimonas coralicida]MCD1645245.1 hypothetical protein [Aurantimonas coralicida]
MQETPAEKLIGIHEKMNDLFLRELITHLELNVPAFGGRQFLDMLYVRQEILPSPGKSDPRQPKSLEETALEIWRRKIDLTEKAMSSAEGIRQRGG